MTGRDNRTEINSLAHVTPCLYTHQMVIDTILFVAHERHMALIIIVQIESGISPCEGVFGVCTINGAGIKTQHATFHAAQFGGVIV